MSVSTEELWLVLDRVDRKNNLLMDTGATSSVLISHTGSFSFKNYTVTGVDRKPHTHFFTGPLTCQFEQCLISYVFLLVPKFLPYYWEETVWAPPVAILWLGGPN